MAFIVTKEAANWYKEEMDLEQGDYVQYYLQIYGGIPTSLPNYSLGMSVGESEDIAVKVEVAGITFYFKEDNAWLFNEYDLTVDVEKDDLSFEFSEKEA
ncbi:hypothetical protein DX933_14890 [Ornithinibacillus gellani]|uniref:HesB/YadR/YfhF family protein n=1 Tax=Ornithinibacillus gellani TaxID=2293253 RepID=UPI000F496927|nr:hypothetical protein [Ornithinibacillus gellani]TQS71865.1 hypothetical protein DX933_14890 [Ornithinibacillus gellani]